jgi:hypothetical protein
LDQKNNCTECCSHYYLIELLIGMSPVFINT